MVNSELYKVLRAIQNNARIASIVGREYLAKYPSCVHGYANILDNCISTKSNGMMNWVFPVNVIDSIVAHSLIPPHLSLILPHLTNGPGRPHARRVLAHTVQSSCPM
jgi:hypothetical protein